MIACPACRVEVTFPEGIRGVTVCPACKRTIARELYGYRVATSGDTVPLTEDERKALKKLRRTAA